MGAPRAISITGPRLTLAEALGAKAGTSAPTNRSSLGTPVIALVGAGGKTTAMLRLAREFASAGERVVITTTTHIFPPSSPLWPPPLLAASAEECVSKVRDALQHHPAVVLARGLTAEEPVKLVGIDSDLVEALRQRLPGVTILVEADGSRGHPLKAPAEHEPVIPAASDLAVVVAGLSAIGCPLDDAHVHRAERFARLAGIGLGEPITPEALERVLRHAEGGRRGIPRGARAVALLNQVDDDTRLEFGRKIAGLLVGGEGEAAGGFERVAIAGSPNAGDTASMGMLQTGTRVPGGVSAREFVLPPTSSSSASKRVAAVVLAAGQSKRMGSLKLALRIGGKSILRRVVETALSSPAEEVIVVLGHGADELRAELPTDQRLRTVVNPDFAQGQSSSVRAGLAELRAGTDAAVMMLGDEPLVSAEAISTLIEAFAQTGAPLIRARYLRGAPSAGGARGVLSHPVLFARPLFAELTQISGDQGGREVMARHQEQLWVNLDLDPPVDVDTPDDFQRIAARFSPGS